MTRSVADNTIKPIPAYPRGSHFKRDSWEMKLQSYRKVSISPDPRLSFVSQVHRYELLQLEDAAKESTDVLN